MDAEKYTCSKETSLPGQVPGESWSTGWHYAGGSNERPLSPGSLQF